jgi:hypothetical protein
MRMKDLTTESEVNEMMCKHDIVLFEEGLGQKIKHRKPVGKKKSGSMKDLKDKIMNNMSG